MKTFPVLSLPILVLTLGLSVSGAVRAQTLLNDSFADGNRTTQNPPGSAAWWLRGNADALSAATGSMTYDSSGQTVNIVGYFTGSSSPHTLLDGQTMTLSITVSASAIADASNGVRFGLFNSGGQQVSGNSTNFQSSTFANYQGYSVAFNPADVSSGYNLYDRVGTNDAIFSSSSSVNAQLGASNSAAIGMDANTPVTLELSLSRSGSSLTIESLINGVSLQRVDSSVSTFAFDTVAWQFSSSAIGASDTATFTNFSVVVVPEPAAAALAGLGLVALLSGRRRARLSF